MRESSVRLKIHPFSQIEPNARHKHAHAHWFSVALCLVLASARASEMEVLEQINNKKSNKTESTYENVATNNI